MTEPDTPLDDVAQHLDEAYAQYLDDKDATTKGGASCRPGFSTPPADMLDAGYAVSFPFTLYGNEYTVLAWLDETHYGGFGICAVLYSADADVESLDGRTVRESTYIETTHIKSGDIDNEDVADDTPHLLATALGYLTRYLLDGRDYGYYGTPRHDEATIDDLSA